MASLHGSRPIRILTGLALLSLLAGIFYVGATLPPSEPLRPVEEHPPARESAALGDLESLDALDPRDDAILRIIEEDPERFFGGPCIAEIRPDTPSD